jgi:MFS family permease
MKPAFLNVQVWSCGFYTGLMNLPLMIISAMIGNLYLTEQLHFSLMEASLITSMISIGTIVGSPLYGFMSDFFQKKRIWMVLGSLLTLASFLVMMNLKNPSINMMSLLFFLLGLFSASQVLGYPMITDSSEEKLKGTSMGVAALIIMGLAFVVQPLTGYLIEISSKEGTYDFHKALLIFPIGFILSFLLSLVLKEKRVEEIKEV